MVIDQIGVSEGGKGVDGDMVVDQIGKETEGGRVLMEIW